MSLSTIPLPGLRPIDIIMSVPNWLAAFDDALMPLLPPLPAILSRVKVKVRALLYMKYLLYPLYIGLCRKCNTVLAVL